MMILAYTATGLLVTMLIWAAIEFIAYLYKYSKNEMNAAESQAAAFVICIILASVYVS